MARSGGQAGRDDQQVATGSVALVLGDEPAATKRARRWAAEHLLAAGLDELSDDAALVVAELVSNALLHAGPPAEVVLQLAPPRARVEVRDRSPEAPIRAHHDIETMTGRGLRIVEAIAKAWGVEQRAVGKCVWVELENGAAGHAAPSADEAPLDPAEADGEALLEAWTTEDEAAAEGEAAPPHPVTPAAEARFTVRLGDIPTSLLLAAKAHVDDLVREFTLAAAGARSGATVAVPRHLAELLEAVVDRFAEPRQMIKRQAIAAANARRDHVTLELTLPASAADAGERYLAALDEADAYCRAARLLTLETPPQQRVFRRWYVEQLIRQLRRAAAGQPPAENQTFEERLLAELDAVAAAERKAERGARLYALAAALAGAATPEEVAARVLNEGVAAMGASGGGLLLVTGQPTLEVPGTLGYDEAVVAGLRSESLDAELPAAYAARTGEAVWLESRRERDERFPELAGFEPRTVAMCAVPLQVGNQVLGALRFSFARARLFDSDERAFAMTMAAQTAQALDRALLHHRQSENLRRLQRNLLPPGLPAIPGLEVASHYDPAEANEIGGDFYDLVGSDSEWTLVVGDVRGKGIEAATLTAMARHTVRGGALRGLQPSEIVGLLNDAFLTDQSPESFCTAACGRLTLHDDHAALAIACGGHPEPLVLRADGSVQALACKGLLVGALESARYEAVTDVLGPGDLLLLYTDGVPEARRDGEFFGRQRMEALLADAAGAPAEAVIERLHEAVEAFQTGQRDDTAMLAVRVLPTGP